MFKRRPADVDLDDLERHLNGLASPKLPVPQGIDHDPKAIERAIAEFAPPAKRAEFSLDRVEEFLSRHLKELAEVQTALAEQRAELKTQLAEIERQQAVTQIAHDALGDTLASIVAKMRALEKVTEAATELADVS